MTTAPLLIWLLLSWMMAPWQGLAPTPGGLKGYAAGGPVTFDTSGSASCASSCSATSLNASPTVGSGSNRQLFVLAWAGCGSGKTAPTLSSITANGGAASLTQIIHATPDPSRYVDLWELSPGTQPTSGSNTVAVTMASALNAACDATATWGFSVATFAGVNQSTPLRVSNSNSGTGTTASATLSSGGANDLTIHAACAGTTLSSPTGTARATLNLSNANSCGDYIMATAPANTTSFSMTVGASDSWIHVAGAIQP